MLLLNTKQDSIWDTELAICSSLKQLRSSQPAQLQAVQYTTRFLPSNGSSATRMAGSRATRYWISSS